MDKETSEVTPAQGTTFCIKNMVCPRCIMAVEQVLARLGFTPLHVELGKAVVRETPDEANEAFSQLAEEYSLDYGYEIEPYLWTAVHHNFTSPFYYISYAMSAIPSLEIYALSLEDRSEAIHVYLNIVDENGYRPFLNCLSDNDLASPFEEEAYLCIETLVKNTIASLAGGSDAPLLGVTVQAETLRPAA